MKFCFTGSSSRLRVKKMLLDCDTGPEIQDIARGENICRDFWCAESGTLEPVFVIKFSQQEWRAYNFDTELRINSLSKINDAAEAEKKAEGWGEVWKKMLVLVKWWGESVKRVKWDSGWLSGVKCQKVEVKHSLSRSSDLVSTNEAGECEGECLALGRGGIFKDSLHLQRDVLRHICDANDMRLLSTWSLWDARTN